MESSKGKICPFSYASDFPDEICHESQCAWWCSFAGDCAVPLLAGMFADSDACNTHFNQNERDRRED